MEPITLILLYIFAALCFAFVAQTFAPRRPLLGFAPVCPRCQGSGWAT
jgi:hypothetical protein